MSGPQDRSLWSHTGLAAAQRVDLPPGLLPSLTRRPQAAQSGHSNQARRSFCRKCEKLPESRRLAGGVGPG